MEKVQRAPVPSHGCRFGLSLAGPSYGPNGDVLWSLGRGVLVGKANEAAKLPALRDSSTAQYAQLHASVQTIVDRADWSVVYETRGAGRYERIAFRPHPHLVTRRRAHLSK